MLASWSVITLHSSHTLHHWDALTPQWDDATFNGAKWQHPCNSLSSETTQWVCVPHGMSPKAIMGAYNFCPMMNTGLSMECTCNWWERNDYWEHCIRNNGLRGQNTGCQTALVTLRRDFWMPETGISEAHCQIAPLEAQLMAANLPNSAWDHLKNSISLYRPSGAAAALPGGSISRKNDLSHRNRPRTACYCELSADQWIAQVKITSPRFRQLFLSCEIA